MTTGGVVHARGQVPGVVWSMGLLDLAVIGVALHSQNWVLLAVVTALGVVMAVIGRSAAITRYQATPGEILVTAGLARSQSLAFSEINQVGTLSKPHKNIVLAAADGRHLVLGPGAIRDGPDFLRAVLERCRWAEFDPAVLAAYGLEISPAPAEAVAGE